MIAELENSIKKAKLEQFKELLNQDETIPAISIPEVEKNLSGDERRRLSSIIRKLDAVTNIKLLLILRDGITPEEQREVYNVLREKLSDDDIIALRDILGKFVER